MLKTLYDVIIVGGGPAGATAGRYLAQQGFTVVVLEKDPLPRFKPCGGGLTLRLLRRFPDLKDCLDPYVLKRIDTIHFYAPDFSSIRYTYDEPLSLMIQRREFDAMLIERCREAGAAVIAPRRVVGITVTENFVDVHTNSHGSFRGNAVIGADGVNSVVANSTGLRGKWRRTQVMLSVVAECPVTPQKFQDSGTIYILFGFCGLGYGWLFPKGELINLGIAGMLSENQQMRIKTRFDEFLQALKARKVLAPTFEATNLRGGLIPIKGILPQTQTDRVILCGDAAGFVNAITGEGIYYAMVSGDLAAKSLAKALRAGNLSEAALYSYQHAWQQELGEEIAETVHIQEKLLTKPRLTNTVVRTVAKHEGMKRTFTDYFMGKISHKALKRSLMLHFLPQYLKLQAAKVLRGFPARLRNNKDST